MGSGLWLGDAACAIYDRERQMAGMAGLHFLAGGLTGAMRGGTAGANMPGRAEGSEALHNVCICNKKGRKNLAKSYSSPPARSNRGCVISISKTSLFSLSRDTLAISKHTWTSVVPRNILLLHSIPAHPLTPHAQHSRLGPMSKLIGKLLVCLACLTLFHGQSLPRLSQPAD